MPRTIAMVVLLLVGCEAPVGAPPGQGAEERATTAAPATGRASASAVASAAPTGARDAAAADAAAASASAAIAEPALLGPDGGVLAQTEDEPSVDDPWFQQQIGLLWEAIVHDEPERARGFFFPVVAYEEVKGIEEPAKDWKYRLWKHFVRDVHEYHSRLGKNRDGAKLVRLELRSEPAWMKPGKEGNLLGYWRVTRSFLHFEWADGKKGRFDLTSMISWRGKWYVVHLHGFG